MGDEESGDSDTSPKTSPKLAVRPESLLKSIGQRPLGDHQKWVLLYHVINLSENWYDLGHFSLCLIDSGQYPWEKVVGKKLTMSYFILNWLD